ncbi:MAG TPA: hypothetical protein VMO80_11075 [Terriglobales bacterium]|jgi:hypothetical protein|nr:hypothetical protein [Terriglobales bacterium]
MATNRIALKNLKPDRLALAWRDFWCTNYFFPEPSVSMASYRRRCSSLVLTGAALVALQPAQAVAQDSNQGSAQAGLTTSQVVDRITEKNAERSNALESYTSRRFYRFDFVGFPENLHAEMTVDVRFRAPATKEFTVRSQSGSKWVISHIFKRLLDSEHEALDPGNPERIALNSQNYNFTMLADQTAGEACPYVLAVQPKVPSKFLYRGRIWVDAKDFAVCRIEGEPAQNPSFWIKKTEIHHAYLKTGDFWLPAENQSISTLRLGGRATLTIKYEGYKIVEAHPVNETSSKRSSFTSTGPKPTN